jgi:hypothetical protein
MKGAAVMSFVSFRACVAACLGVSWKNSPNIETLKAGFKYGCLNKE